MNIMNIPAISNPALNTGKLRVEQAAGEGFQAAMEAALQHNDESGLKKACESFESYFLQIMFREMRSTGGFVAKSNAEMIFEDMLYEEYSKTAASMGGIGLADMMIRQLRRQPEN